MVTQNLAVAGESSQGVQEGVAFLGLCVLCQLIGAKKQRLVDKVIDKSVDDFQASPEGSFGNVGTQRGCSGEDVLDMLNSVEGFRKLLFDSSGVYMLAQGM